MELLERESGFLVRMLAAPASRASIVTCRFIYLAAVTITQGLIIMAAAPAMQAGTPPAWSAWPLAMRSVRCSARA